MMKPSLVDGAKGMTLRIDDELSVLNNYEDD